MPNTPTPQYGITEILNVVDDAVAIELAVVEIVPVISSWNWLQIPTVVKTFMELLPSLRNLLTLNLPEFINEVKALDPQKAQVVANEVAADLKKDGLPYADVIVALLARVTDTYNMVQGWVADVKKWFHLP